MKILKFRIKNYKSIIDSGDCYLEENITILAGKNESGKTAILEALEDFDTERKLRDKAIPIYNLQAKPEISVTFQPEEATLKEIYAKLSLQVPEKTIDKIEIIKKYPDKYFLSSETADVLNIKSLTLIEDRKKQIQDLISGIGNVLNEFKITEIKLPALILDNLKDYKTQSQSFLSKMQPHLPKITDEQRKGLIAQDINKIIEICSELENLDLLENKFIEEIKRYIPYFILFSSFDDIFPSEIPLIKAQENKLVKDLALISNLNLELIQKGTATHKATHKEQLNIKVKDEYKRYWTQDLTHLFIDWDSNNLLFFVKEGDKFFPPELRSKGKQWHLAFYIRVAARAREDVPNIILIDEPGLFLHAKAQKDILKILEDSSTGTPIVFSTHSPYLLEPDKFNRIRLISYDEKNGTLVENKIHKVSDKETLTPILTAIGLELSSSIESIDKINNVIVEGQSDWFYLQAFKRIMNKTHINFVFGGGSGNMPFVGTILCGWGCNVLYLFDNDKGKKDAEKNLRQNWILSQQDILGVADKDGERIEDIFDQKDFKKFVLDDEAANYTSTNSEYLNKHKKDKVLPSKLFLEKIEQNKCKLSQETLAKIKSLFDNLEKAFKKEFGK